MKVRTEDRLRGGLYLAGLAAGAVVEDCDGEGLSHTDGVGHLDETPLAEPSTDEGLGHPPGGRWCRW